jgi:hypothetical protein
MPVSWEAEAGGSWFKASHIKLARSYLKNKIKTKRLETKL